MTQIQNSMKLLRSSIWILICSVICYMILCYANLKISKIDENEFVFSFLGILLGFSLTVFTFIVSLVEKIKDKAELKYEKDKSKKNKLQSIIDSLYTEIKEDIFFTFFSLLVVSLIYIFEQSINDINLCNLKIDKILMFKSIRVSIFLLNLYAVYDLIIISFELSDTVGIMKKVDEDNIVK